jgi:predicted nucleic acid-binding protein
MRLLDTDIAVHLRDGTPEIVRRWQDLGERAVVSLMTLVELEGGVVAVPELAERRRSALQALMRHVDVIGLDRDTVAAYAAVLAVTGYNRRRVIDRLIAATAIANDLTLATINADDFRDIPGLTLDVWAPPAQ